MATNLSTRRPTSGPEEFSDEWMAQQRSLMSFGGEAAAVTTPAAAWSPAHLDPNQDTYTPDEISPDDSWRSVPLLKEEDNALIEEMAAKHTQILVLHVSDLWTGKFGEGRTAYFTAIGSMDGDGNPLLYARVLSAGEKNPYREERLQRWRTVCLNGKRIGPCMFQFKDTDKGNAYLDIVTWKPAVLAGRKAK